MSSLLIFLISISLFAEELPKIQVKSVADMGEIILPRDQASEAAKLLAPLPNFNSSSGSNRTRFLQIRGVGQTGQFEHSQVNSVGVFFEGIDLSEEASVLPIWGRETWTAKYGPQSLRWGSKAFAGDLEGTSCLARNCAPFFARMEYGSFETTSLTAEKVYNYPNFSSLVGLNVGRSNGYFRNIHLGKPGAYRNEKEALLGLGYAVTGWKFREHHIFADHRNGYDSWAFSPSYDTLSDKPGLDRHQVHGHSLVYERSTGESRFHGLTSFTSTQQVESYDEDWSYDPSYDYFAEFDRHRTKLHQKLGWEYRGFEVGVHYAQFREEQIIRSFKSSVLRREAEPVFRSRSLALWSGKSWSFADWKLTASMRAEKQWIALEGLGPEISQGVEPQWAVDVKAERALTENLNSEVSFVRGYRGGGYNTSPDLARENLDFDPEQLHLVQWTTRHKGTDRQFIGNLFYQWQQHQQSRTSQQSDPLDPNSFFYYTRNEGSSRSFGLEGIAIQQAGRWTLRESLGLLHSRYRHRELAQAPKWSYNLRLEYAPYPWLAFAQMNGRAAFYHSDDHDFKSKPYHLVDAGVEYVWHRWQLRLTIENIFDQQYPVRAFYFANEPPDWEEKYYTQLGPPRTARAQLICEF